VAPNTELGIVLGKIIESIGNVTAAEKDYQEESNDKQLRLEGYRFLQSRCDLSDLSSGPINELHATPSNYN
jgi:hypothetical protein